MPPNGWRDGIAPTGSGDETIVLGPSFSETIFLPSGFAAGSIVVMGENDFQLLPSGEPPVSIQVGSIVFATPPTEFSRLSIAGGIRLDVPVATVLSLSPGSDIVMSGTVAGAGSLTLLGGGFVISNNPEGNSYAGGTFIGDAHGGGGVAFWNDTPFGSGPVTIFAGSQLIAHGHRTLANPITLQGGGIPGSVALALRTWDSPLTLSGGLTLAGDATLHARVAPPGTPSPDSAGSFALPGTPSRHPIVISGPVSGEGRTLSIAGPGVIILDPEVQNSYTGGTVMLGGSLVMGNPLAFPSTGMITGNVGYVGIGFADSGSFASYLTNGNKLASSFAGTIGVDTLPGAASTTVLADSIDLTTFTGTISLGTATEAIVTSPLIKPRAPEYYHFGGGGGSLYVQTALGNVPEFMTGLRMNSPFGGTPPLKLFLQGANTYAGSTEVYGGNILILDGAGALSPNTTLTAREVPLGDNLIGVGGSYIGMTPLTEMSPATFLNRFNKPGTWGIIGFDTHGTDPTAAYSDIDLTGFNDGVYIGTATRAAINGTLTPTTVGNLHQAPNQLRFTAANGGVLDVNSSITGSVGVVHGVEENISSAFSNGTVVLNGANDYNGGTSLFGSLNGLTVEVGNSTAFGSGALKIVGEQGRIAGLRAAHSEINIGNALQFTGNPGAGLFLTGSAGFELSGAISGKGELIVRRSPQIQLITEQMVPESTAFNMTLSGDNSGFSGRLVVQDGDVTLGHDNAVGTGTLELLTPGSHAQFTTLAPTLYGLEGDDGTQLILAENSQLTLNVAGEDSDFDFLGLISGADNGVANASIVVHGTSTEENGVVYLGADNRFSGGATITGSGILALGHANAAGTGTVTVNAPTGGLVLAPNVTFTNPLVYTSGALAGFGTFDSPSYSTLTFDTGKMIVPGLPGLAEIAVGELKLMADSVFAGGGRYVWGLQNGDFPDGFSHLFIDGNLDIAAAAGGFTLEVNTFDVFGEDGFAALQVGQNYSLNILTVSGAITGPLTGIGIDASHFQNGEWSQTQFGLSLDETGKSILLNFTPVPEPSTYVLLALGLGFVALNLYRRRSL